MGRLKNGHPSASMPYAQMTSATRYCCGACSSLVALLAPMFIGCSKPDSVISEKNPPPVVAPAPPPVSATAPPTIAKRAPSPELSAFLPWVGAHRATPRKAAPEAKCFGKGEADAGWCEGFCQGIELGGSASCIVRYWKADPRAVRFDAISVSGSIDCGDLDSAASRSQNGADIGCRLAAPGLSGMRALINRRGGSTSAVFIMTPEYLERDRAMSVP